jgi:Flp pilus assembly protein TadB
MDIPDGEFWAGIGTIIAAAVAYAFWAAMNYMTRAEHARLCTERNEGVQRQLTSIEEMVREHRTEMRGYRRQDEEDREQDQKEQREYQRRMADSAQATSFRVVAIETTLGMKTKGPA